MRLRRRLRQPLVPLASAAILMLGWLGPPRAWGSSSEPAATIDGTSLAAAREILTPGLEALLRRGWKLRVGAAERIEMPADYRHATEKFSAQVDLGRDGDTLLHYVAGMPFPILDPADPEVATKIVWNHLMSWRATDDLAIHSIEAEAGPIAADGTFRVEQTFRVPVYRELGFAGRVEHDPRPEIDPASPIGHGALVESFADPIELRNVSLLRLRFRDGARADDVWAYLPSTRRVRRIGPLDTSQPPFGQDVDFDSLWGYAGRVADMSWRFLGAQTVLATVHAEHVPVRWQAPGFGFDEVWEPRRVWVVEGTPKIRRSKQGRRVLFVDRESSAVVHSDVYDRGGNLWKVWVGAIRFPRPGDGRKFPLYPAMIMVDVRASHATRVALPAPRRAVAGDRPEWRVNEGLPAATMAVRFDPASLER